MTTHSRSVAEFASLISTILSVPADLQYCANDRKTAEKAMCSPCMIFTRGRISGIYNAQDQGPKHSGLALQPWSLWGRKLVSTSPLLSQVSQVIRSILAFLDAFIVTACSVSIIAAVLAVSGDWGLRTWLKGSSAILPGILGKQQNFC